MSPIKPGIEEKERKIMGMSAKSIRKTNEGQNYNVCTVNQSTNDFKDQSSQCEFLQMKVIEPYDSKVVKEEMGDNSSPNPASNAFKTNFHLLKHPKKVQSVRPKKRKLPGVMTISLSLKFSESCNCDKYDDNTEKSSKLKIMKQYECPTPSNSPSSPNTIEDGALSSIYCDSLEEDISISIFDESLDDSLDSFTSDYKMLGLDVTSDEERVREYWKFCYGSQTIDIKNPQFVHDISKDRHTKSCIPNRRCQMEQAFESKKRVQFGGNVIFEFDPLDPPDFRMD